MVYAKRLDCRQLSAALAQPQALKVADARVEPRALLVAVQERRESAALQTLRVVLHSFRAQRWGTRTGETPVGPADGTSALVRPRAHLKRRWDPSQPNARLVESRR
jgi:hypothetical protein